MIKVKEEYLTSKRIRIAFYPNSIVNGFCNVPLPEVIMTLAFRLKDGWTPLASLGLPTIAMPAILIRRTLKGS